MIKYHLKIAYRNLIKNKVNTLLTISGFGLAVSLVILIALYSWKELSMNQFHHGAKNIYKVSGWGTPNALAPFLEERIPEIESIVRISGNRAMEIIKEDNSSIRLTGFIYTEDSFFDVFTFPIISGNHSILLSKPYSVVLTETASQKLFGDINPIGKTIRTKEQNYLVTGIMKDPPNNSSLKFNALVSLTSREAQQTSVKLKDDWGNFSFETFAKFRPPVNKEILTHKIQETIKEQGNLQYEVEHVKLYTLKDLYFNSNLFSQFRRGNEKNVKSMIWIGIAILLLAIINFFNLSTSQGITRAKEIGVRKVSGGKRTEIARQIIYESALLAFLSITLALVLVNLAIPWFNQISLSQFGFLYLQNWWQWVVLFGGTIVLALVAGSYPAFYLSSFKALDVIKVLKIKAGSVIVFRKALVVFQFSVTIVLIVAMLFITKQLNYLTTKNLGFEKDAILCIRPNQAIIKNYNAYAGLLQQNPGIMGISNTFGYIGNYDSGFKLFSKVLGEEKEIWCKQITTDTAFFKTFGVHVIEETSYDKNINHIYLNQAAVHALGANSLQGIEIKNRNETYTRVAGVTSNFHFRSLKNGVQPLMINIIPEMKGLINVRFNPKSYKSISELIKYCEEAQAKIAPNEPFRYDFLDDFLAQSYEAEKRFRTIITFLAFFAITISCLGLIGMVIFSNSSRTKEIGVRKVLGAKVSSILGMLISSYTKWIIVAFVISTPLGYFIMNRWLSNFPYRTNLNWWVFVLAGLITYLIAVTIVFAKSRKTATRNPVVALKYE